MTQLQLLDEFSQLTLPQQLEMLQSALEIVSAKVRVASSPADNDTSSITLAQSAALLLADYENDEELTSFTVLDGAPFHPQGELDFNSECAFFANG